MLWNTVLAALLSTLLPDQSAPAPAKNSATPSATTAKVEAAPAQAIVIDLIEVEKEMLEKANSQRAKYGLPPLSVDRSLIQTARSHAAWMTNNQVLQHTDKQVGENIAMGQRSTDEAVKDWMASPGHRANILNASYKRTGVAAYRTKDGTIYWCQQFLP